MIFYAMLVCCVAFMFFVCRDDILMYCSSENTFYEKLKVVEYGMVTFALLFGALLGAFFGLLISCGTSIVYWEKFDDIEAVHEQVYHTEIISIKNESSVSGSFFLGSGGIGTSEHYYYFEKTNDGGIKRGQVSARHTVIYERGNETPRVEWTHKTIKKPLLVRMGFKETDYITRQYGPYRLIVPENTVITRFQLD